MTHKPINSDRFRLKAWNINTWYYIYTNNLGHGQFRYDKEILQPAINIKVLSEPKHHNYFNGRQTWQSDIQVEFLHDDMPSEFANGILYHDTF